jgi:hypothetical protein
LGAPKRLEFLNLKRALNGAEAIRPLRMARRRKVIETGRMGNQ